jgi:hypothetical protein
MPSNSLSDHEWVKICMAELCKQAGFPAAEKLVQRDLNFLSEWIESRTGVLISLSTIKRLLNGQFSRLPQIATLDALARSVGYENWQRFKGDNSGKTMPLPEDGPTIVAAGDPEEDTAADPEESAAGEPKEDAAGSPARIKSVPARPLLIAGLLLIIALGLLAVIRIRKPGAIDAGTAQFSVVKVTRNDLPNTVIFKYNIDDVNADSFFIQQSWDRNRRVKIYKKAYTLTDIYYEPGYHTAKLIANDRIIRTLPVSIPTDRWLFYAKERTRLSQPQYILPARSSIDGSMQLTADDLASSKIDREKDNDYLQVYFPSAIAYSSDNFILTCKVKVNECRNASCPYLMTEIFCQHYFMYFQNTLKGCTGALNAQFGDNILSGKNNDLSALGTDVRNWQDLEMEVKKKTVSIRINHVEVFSTAYEKSCGLITGLGFISNGLCVVDFVQLKTADGKDIYSNDFNN